jgi:hypothetical protein
MLGLVGVAERAVWWLAISPPAVRQELVTPPSGLQVSDRALAHGPDTWQPRYDPSHRVGRHPETQSRPAIQAHYSLRSMRSSMRQTLQIL